MRNTSVCSIVQTILNSAQHGGKEALQVNVGNLLLVLSSQKCNAELARCTAWSSLGMQPGEGVFVKGS